ncbi:uncharacterized protein Z519_01829 [Cladophialophora bantiana CBS 173.52]|uniref:Enoyl reductase (ER) domain-containing protein n=1 Tax=Cladophialophora bantiana (strain ATCC 10958 / CBS 173.52 / CDC B-1940 / NIH 8579) TaxID=1442370 RepID=A0A0D2I4N6_CLAB1|nr:uncharacterized protein Z519_01829 [Cladophialophora bantiana CBS 173.52]KIW98245.1 hypothetical protein Z519_01829 [Cladophialophora bantiana CBS 173.52]
MKAARFHPDTQKVSVDIIDIPTPGDNEILVKMRSASLCHTDLMLIHGERPVPSAGPPEPVTMGHEGAGYVEAWGKNVTGYAKGDRIGFLYIKGCCFECVGCQLHNLNCTRSRGLLQGFDTDGMLAEYATIDYRNAVHLPKSMLLDTASAFFCAGFTAFHGIDGCECQPGDWLAVVGCGGLGLFGIKYAKAMGFKVISIDVNDQALQVAKDAGADLVVNTSAQSDWQATIKRATNGGVRAAAVFSAVQAGYDTAMKIVGLGGVLMVVGLPPKGITFDPNDLCRKLYRIKAENTGQPSKLARAMQFTAEHNITPRSEFFKIDQISEMIAKMESGKSTRRLTVLF